MNLGEDFGESSAAATAGITFVVVSCRFRDNGGM